MTTSVPKSLKNDEWLKIGTVGPAHGVQGAFFCYTDDRRSEALSYREVLLVFPQATALKTAADETKKVYHVRRSFLSAGRPVLALDQVCSREKADELLGATIYVRRSTSELDSDEFFVGDLIGLEVFCPSSEVDVLKRGKVVAVHSFGAQFNLEIELAQPGLMQTGQGECSSNKELENSTVFFPFIDKFIVTLDLEKRMLVVEGLDQFL